jgi:hypothetical protein
MKHTFGLLAGMFLAATSASADPLEAWARGQWYCNDDTNGANPLMAFRLAAANGETTGRLRITWGRGGGELEAAIVEAHWKGTSVAFTALGRMIGAKGDAIDAVASCVAVDGRGVAPDEVHVRITDLEGAVLLEDACAGHGGVTVSAPGE